MNDGCPLQRLLPSAMLVREKVGPDHCPIVDFTRWAADWLPPPVEKSVGRLQVIYLYRSKKAPFYHEYVVTGFGADGEVPTSWVRLERAARIKDSPLFPQADTLRPLFKGVEARETMSFSSSRDELCKNSNQLGEIVLQSPTSTPLYIRAIAHQVMSTSISNNLYQLFTANCPWFSRRGFLNVLQWCESDGISYSATWKGSSAAAERIRMKLEQERFGGSKLGDLRSKGLDHRNLLNLALARTDWGQLDFTSEIFDPYLESLETAPVAEDERSVLIADLLTKRSYIGSTTGDPKQALEDAEHATALMRALPPDAYRREEQFVWSLAALSFALRMNDRAEEAVTAMEEAIELDDNRGSSVTAYRYVEQGVNLKTVGRLEDAANAFAVAVKIFARVDRRLEWSDTRLQQINTLRLLAQTLDVLERTPESFIVRHDIVAICRDLPPREETSGENRLIIALLELAASASLEGEFAEARATAAEAASLCREYQVGGESLSMSLIIIARLSHQLGDLAAAIEALTEAIAAKRESNDDSSGAKLGTLHRILATYWLEADNFAQALEAINDEISIHRTAWRENPADEASIDSLAEALSTRGAILRKVERPEEAVEAFAESIDVLRPLSEESDTRLLNFAQTLELLAKQLVDIGRPEDGREIADESLSFYRALYLRSPSSETRDVLREALLRQTHLLTGMDAKDEALEVVSQAVQLGEHLEPEEGHISAILQKMLQEVGIGSFDQALATAEWAVQICETQLTERRDLNSMALTSCARALDELGRHDEAAEKQEQSITILRDIVDLSSAEGVSSLAIRLAKLSEYLQDAGLFERALARIVECVDMERDLWAGDQTQEMGLSLCQSIARQASILYSLDRRTEAAVVLAEQSTLLRLILVERAQMTPDDLLNTANQHRFDSIRHSMGGRNADAADSLRQSLLIARLAFSVDGEVTPEEGTPSSLEDALKEFAMFAAMNGMVQDSVEAIVEAVTLSHGAPEDPETFSKGLAQIIGSVDRDAPAES